MNPKIIIATFFLTMAASAVVESNIDWSKVYPRSALDDNGQLKENAKPMAQVRSGRLLGGQDIAPYARPYLAALFSTHGTITFCQGSIISVRAVLTRAYCVYSSMKTDVLVGSHDILQGNGKSIVVGRAAYRIPDEYSLGGISFDIAVLTLPEILMITSLVKPIAIPSRNLEGTGKMATIVSWGTNNTPTSVTNIILASDECKKFFKGFFTDDHICLNTIGGNGPCFKDEAAPLVLTDDRGILTLVGQFEYIQSSCDSGNPAAFTKISSHIGFIERYI